MYDDLVRRQVWLPLGLLFLAGCAASVAGQSPRRVVEPSALVSAVPAESFDRTDLPCYYGAVW